MDSHAAGAHGPLSGTPSASSLLGPHMSNFLTTCFNENPSVLTFLLGSGGIAVLVTILVTVRHIMALQRTPICLLRMYYFRITWFAPAFGLTAFVSLLCPRSYFLCKMVQVQFEALTIFFFGTIMFLLLAEESVQLCKREKMRSGGIGHDILRALKAQGPRKHFAVPPFGCCFRPFVKPHDMEPGHLLWARFFFQQYAFVVVVGSMLVTYTALAMEMHTVLGIKKAVGIITKVSGFLAIYGLMILYVATHDLLEHWRTTAKFISIKLVVLLCAFQEWLTGWLAARIEPLQCVNVLNADNRYSDKLIEKHREHFMNMYLICLEAVLVAFLVYRAFPAVEVRQFEHESHLLLVQMDLAKRVQDVEQASDSDSDSDADDREN